MSLQLYYAPVPGHVYTMGLDDSRGGGHDASALVVLDAMTAPVQEVACFRGKTADARTLACLAWDLHLYGYTVAKGNAYRERGGGLVPEINFGLTGPLEALFSLDYWYIQAKGPTPKRPSQSPIRWGFYTTEPSTTAIIGDLRAALITRAIKFSNPWFQDEAKYWEKFEGNWKFGLQSGHEFGHGDVTRAFALALAGVQAVQDGLVTLQARKREPPLENLVYADLSNPLRSPNAILSRRR